MTACCTAQVRAFALQLLQGLAAMHAAGVAHTDIKPGNLLVMGSTELGFPDVGSLVLADFGLTIAAGKWLAQSHCCYDRRHMRDSAVRLQLRCPGGSVCICQDLDKAVPCVVRSEVAVMCNQS